MNNTDLQIAIDKVFQGVLDSYKFGNSYGSTEFHKFLLVHLDRLLRIQLDRAVGVVELIKLPEAYKFTANPIPQPKPLR